MKRGIVPSFPNNLTHKATNEYIKTRPISKTHGGTWWTVREILKWLLYVLPSDAPYPL
jgi:hypothetical protein